MPHLFADRAAPVREKQGAETRRAGEEIIQCLSLSILLVYASPCYSIVHYFQRWPVSKLSLLVTVKWGVIAKRPKPRMA